MLRGGLAARGWTRTVNAEPPTFRDAFHQTSSMREASSFFFSILCPENGHSVRPAWRINLSVASRHTFRPLRRRADASEWRPVESPCDSFNLSPTWIEIALLRPQIFFTCHTEVVGTDGPGVGDPLRMFVGLEVARVESSGMPPVSSMMGLGFTCVVLFLLGIVLVCSTTICFFRTPGYAQDRVLFGSLHCSDLERRLVLAQGDQENKEIKEISEISDLLSLLWCGLGASPEPAARLPQCIGPALH